MTRVDPAGDQEVARALGGAATEDRRLDLEEAEIRHYPPHELREPVADDENLLQVRPAQVEVAIRQPELLVGLRPMDLEGRGRRGVIDDELLGPDLDRARLEPGILLAGQPRGHRPPNSDDVLVSQLTGSRLELLSGFG